MESEIAQGQIAITELAGKLTVDVVDKILFDSGQTEIRPAGLDVLRRVVDILISVTDKMIRIEGHTDSVGSDASNMRLSLARAEKIRDYLVEKMGISASLLEARGFGESNPVADNNTQEGRQQNRRVVLIAFPQ
jgi:chemotaxis protein MotB